MKETIIVKDLKKIYTSYERIGFFKKKKTIIEALKGISFKISSGEVFGLLGPNGAGKTTTVKILSTLLLPDGGYASVMGYDVVKEASRVRKVIGVSLSVEKGFFWKLTGKENLKYFGMLYGLDGSKLNDRVEYLLELVGLKKLGVVDKLYEEYSLGMKARLSLARAMLLDPPVLILDEPTLGLDPPSARALRELLVKFAHEDKKTVLVTTHNMFEAEILCDRVAIIDLGRIIAIGTVEELRNKIGEKVSLAFHVSIPSSINVERLVEVIHVKTGYDLSFVSENGRFIIKALLEPKEVDQATPRILTELHSLKCRVNRVEVKTPSLEDVFIKLTGKKGF